MTAAERFELLRAECPLVAILRGVRPQEIDAIADALVGAGFRMIEVPLNSPDPLDSIARLAERHGEHCLVGAGTVTKVADVASVAQAGGRLVVAPNSNAEVIRSAAARGMVALPGCQTATEAFTAIDAGATGLKLFPAEAMSTAVVKALAAVLPPAMPLLAVGGVTPATMGDWWQVGVRGFGIGGALYRPGDSAGDVGRRAQDFVAAARALAA